MTRMSLKPGVLIFSAGNEKSGATMEFVELEFVSENKGNK